MRRYQFLLFGLVVLIACGMGPLVEAMGNTLATADDANYSLHDVSITTRPPGNGVGTFTVRFRYNQVGTQGAVAPIVALVDWDGGLRFGDDILVAQQHTAVNQQWEEHALTLTCNNGDVTGGSEGSGEGEAEVYARVEHKDGSGGVNSLDTLNITCP